MSEICLDEHEELQGFEQGAGAMTGGSKRDDSKRGRKSKQVAVARTCCTY